METTDTKTKPRTFRATVTITADSPALAEQVLCERINYDEWYGFDYTIGYGDFREINQPQAGPIQEGPTRARSEN